jgi:hypothetical protein
VSTREAHRIGGRAGDTFGTIEHLWQHARLTLPAVDGTNQEDNMRHSFQLASVAAAAALLVVACGGGGGSSDGTGTMRLSLTDAACGDYEKVFVTIEKVRVHQSSGAGEGEGGWSEVVLPTPLRVDLLTLTNGALIDLGQTELPAGTYQQMRLVLAGGDPLANAIQPTGGTLMPLTTPSGQQSGLKMNVQMTVPAGQVADFAIDFDACRSFVKAGNSGQYHLKPVLSVIPILSAAGQRIVGFVPDALANAGTSVSAQVDGMPVRATPPDSTGRFTLYPVPVGGNYQLVVTAGGRVNAVMTGVPVTADTTTVIGNTNLRIDPPASAASQVASGTVTVSGSLANTNGAVRALQSFADATKIEVGYSAADATTGAYVMTLPTGAPVKTAFAAGATSFNFQADAAAAAKYTLEASAPTFTAKTAEIDLAGGNVATNFVFP